MSTAAIAAWYGRQYELAIFATAISVLLGWPFAALLGYYFIYIELKIQSLGYKNLIMLIFVIFSADYQLQWKC